MLINISESVSASVKWGKQYSSHEVKSTTYMLVSQEMVVLSATSFTFSRRETFLFTAFSKVGKGKKIQNAS